MEFFVSSRKHLQQRLALYSNNTIPLSAYELPPFIPSCEKVKKWWDHPAKIKLLCGGNRAGKSITSCAYLIHIARNRPGSLSWAGALTFEMGGDPLYQLMKQYVVPEEIERINWASAGKEIPHSILFKNKSRIVFKSMDSGFKKFEGTKVDGVILLDEEVPDKKIFTSCLARTTGTPAQVILAMTPLRGKTWVYHDIFQIAANRNAVMREKQNANIYAETLTLYDNSFLSREDIEYQISFYSEDEIPYRVFGEWAQLTGRVYPKFNVSSCVVSYSPDILDRCHTILRSIDFGRWKAVTWLGIDHDETVYVLREWKEAEYTIADMASAIEEIEHDMARRTDDTVTDHAFQERFELEQYGIHCTPADKSVRKGIEIINRRIQQCAFFVCDSCPKTIAELEEYIYTQDSPEPKKGQDDHLADTVRYNVTEAEQYCSGRFGDIPRMESVAKSEVM